MWAIVNTQEHSCASVPSKATSLRKTRDHLAHRRLRIDAALGSQVAEHDRRQGLIQPLEGPTLAAERRDDVRVRRARHHPVGIGGREPRP